MRFLEILFILNFQIQRFLLKMAFRVKPRDPSLLKAYLLLDHETRNHVIAKASMPLFDGLHLKNVYNYRSEFFISNLTPDDVVIDLGCGSGVILHNSAHKIKYGYGLDWSDENLHICRRNQKSPNLEFVKADVLSIDFVSFKKKTGYNAAILSHILEHIEDPVAFLKAVNAAKVLICVPSTENWLTQLKIKLGICPFSDSTHFREYTRDTLTRDLQKAGYRIKHIGFNPEGEIACCAEII